MKHLKEMIESALRSVPETRNSDIFLMKTIWRIYFQNKIIQGPRGDAIHLADLEELPREDSIKRIRCMFNSEGKYYPTDWSVAKGRGMEENAWRVALGYPSKEMTVNPTKSESYMDPERSFAGNNQTMF